MIELRHLRTLVALKESGSLVGAAKKRFVTQSALSHQIRELETRINSAVFIRKSKPLSFTEEGVRLLNLAEEILPQVSETEYLLKKGLSVGGQRVNIAIENPSCMRWLTPVIEQFHKQFPNADLNLSSQFKFDSLNALAAEQLDLVLTSDPVPSSKITYQHLFDYEMVLVVANDHPLAKESFIKPNQLKNLTLLSYVVPLPRTDFFRYFMEPAGMSSLAVKHCESTVMLFQKIACQEGVAALPSWLVNEAQEPSLSTVRLGRSGLNRSLIGAYRRHSANINCIQHLLKLISNQGINR